MLTSGKIKVRFICDNKSGFVKNQIYDATPAKSKFCKTEMIFIIDNSGEEYAYPLAWFEIVHEHIDTYNKEDCTMNLLQYYEKSVIVIDTDGVEHHGVVDTYAQPNDNEGQEAIALTSGIWLDESDIKSIELAYPPTL